MVVRPHTAYHVFHAAVSKLVGRQPGDGTGLWSQGEVSGSESCCHFETRSSIFPDMDSYTATVPRKVAKQLMIFT